LTGTRPLHVKAASIREKYARKRVIDPVTACCPFTQRALTFLNRLFSDAQDLGHSCHFVQTTFPNVMVPWKTRCSTPGIRLSTIDMCVWNRQSGDVNDVRTVKK
jgi:hypothetical protein